MDNLSHIIYNWLTGLGMADDTAKYINMIILVAGLLVIIVLTDLLIKNFLLKRITFIARKTKSTFDDMLIQNKVVQNIAHVVPFYIALKLIPYILSDFDVIENLVRKILQIIYILLVIRIVKSVLNTFKAYARTLKSLKDKPIDSYVQVIMIFVWLTGIFTILVVVTNTDIWKFFTALGAASAVLLLVFKDTILGFVASIQVTVNDMVRIGDWITFEKYGADGNVIEITLATVKVQNFDKTITTIPTYALISDSFKNWRGMESSGGRRIKRAIIIKMNSIKYLSTEDVNRLKQIGLLKNYLEKRQNDIEKYNQNNKIDKSLAINGRNLTNIGVFRKYVETYIENHSAVNKDMMIMTRQLAPTTEGLPIEIYAFSSDKRWQNYEYIMADIFDHIIAAVPYFDLEIFEKADTKMLSGYGLTKNPLSN